jgi:hypothetical protein
LLQPVNAFIKPENGPANTCRNALKPPKIAGIQQVSESRGVPLLSKQMDPTTRFAVPQTSPRQRMLKSYKELYLHGGPYIIQGYK